MSLTVVIVHGACGSTEENWFPWLREKLKARGISVVLRQYPTPDGQTFEVWRALFLDQIRGIPKSDLILVGHSIGAAFVLRMAEETDTPYRALFAVCPFVRRLGNPDFDLLNESFVAHDFDWEKVRAGAVVRTCYAGEGDPYVPLVLSEEVAHQASATLIVVPKGGHLNAEAGFLTFPEIESNLLRPL